MIIPGVMKPNNLQVQENIVQNTIQINSIRLTGERVVWHQT